MLNINLNKILYSFLCLYAFLISFEIILEVFWGIVTIWKPYRIVAIVLIPVYFLKNYKRIGFNANIKEDIYIYAIYIYGILISMVQIFFTNFSQDKFNTDLTLFTLNLLLFFILKNINLSKKQWNGLLWSLIAGIIVNALYIVYIFYIVGNYGRQQGLMDNPNFVALSIVIAVSFLALHMRQIKKAKFFLTHLFFILILLSAFITTGSRTGLVVLAIGGGFLFYFTPLIEKIRYGLCILVLLVVYIIINPDTVKSGAHTVLLNRLGDNDLEDDPRFIIWKGVIRAAIDNKFVGMGFGQFKARFVDYFQKENNRVIHPIVSRGYFLSPHSDYFAILSTFGIVGLLLYLLFLFKTTKKIIFKLWNGTNRHNHFLYQFSLIILASLIIYGISSENFSTPMFWFLLAISTRN